MAAKKKPKVGFYDLTGCNGCLLSFIFGDDLLDLAAHVDVTAFRFVKEQKEEKAFELVFVEGLVASNGDLETLKVLRKRSTILVSLGACSETECVPAYRNFVEQEQVIDNEE